MKLHHLSNLAFSITFIGVVVMVIAVLGPVIMGTLTMDKLDKACYQSEKVIYCQSIGMELGSIVVTPGGLFGGRPYNKDACVSENSEKIINYKDVNYERCLPK